MRHGYILLFSLRVILMKSDLFSINNLFYFLKKETLPPTWKKTSFFLKERRRDFLKKGCLLRRCTGFSDAHTIMELWCSTCITRHHVSRHAVATTRSRDLSISWIGFVESVEKAFCHQTHLLPFKLYIGQYSKHCFIASFSGLYASNAVNIFYFLMTVTQCDPKIFQYSTADILRTQACKNLNASC